MSAESETKSAQLHNDIFEWLLSTLSLSLSVGEDCCSKFLSDNLVEIEQYFTTKNKSFLTVWVTNVWNYGPKHQNNQSATHLPQVLPEEVEDLEAMNVSNHMLAEAKAKMKALKKKKKQDQKNSKNTEKVTKIVTSRPPTKQGGQGKRKTKKHKGQKIKQKIQTESGKESEKNESEKLAEIADELATAEGQNGEENNKQYHCIEQINYTIGTFPPSNARTCCFFVSHVSKISKDLDICWIKANYPLKVCKIPLLIPIVESCLKQVMAVKVPSSMDILSMCCEEPVQFHSDPFLQVISHTLVTFGTQVAKHFHLELPDDLAQIVELDNEKLTGEYEERYTEIIRKKSEIITEFHVSIQVAESLEEFIRIFLQNFFLNEAVKLNPTFQDFKLENIDFNLLLMSLSFYSLDYDLRNEYCAEIIVEMKETIEKIKIIKQIYNETQLITTSLVNCIDEDLIRFIINRFDSKFFRSNMDNAAKISSELNSLAKLLNLWQGKKLDFAANTNPTLQTNVENIPKVCQVISDYFQEVSTNEELLLDPVWDMLQNREVHKQAYSTIIQAKELFLQPDFEYLHPVNSKAVLGMVEKAKFNSVAEEIENLINHGKNDAGIMQDEYNKFLQRYTLETEEQSAIVTISRCELFNLPGFELYDR